MNTFKDTHPILYWTIIFAVSIGLVVTAMIGFEAVMIYLTFLFYIGFLAYRLWVEINKDRS